MCVVCTGYGREHQNILKIYNIYFTGCALQVNQSVSLLRIPIEATSTTTYNQNTIFFNHLHLNSKTASFYDLNPNLLSSIVDPISNRISYYRTVFISTDCSAWLSIPSCIGNFFGKHISFDLSSSDIIADAGATIAIDLPVLMYEYLFRLDTRYHR